MHKTMTELIMKMTELEQWNGSNSTLERNSHSALWVDKTGTTQRRANSRSGGGGRRSRPKNTITCWNCGKKGHFQYECGHDQRKMKGTSVNGSAARNAVTNSDNDSKVQEVYWCNKYKKLLTERQANHAYFARHTSNVSHGDDKVQEVHWNNMNKDPSRSVPRKHTQHVSSTSTCHCQLEFNKRKKKDENDNYQNDLTGSMINEVPDDCDEERIRQRSESRHHVVSIARRFSHDHKRRANKNASLGLFSHDHKRRANKNASFGSWQKEYCFPFTGFNSSISGIKRKASKCREDQDTGRSRKDEESTYSFESEDEYGRQLQNVEWQHHHCPSNGDEGPFSVVNMPTDPVSTVVLSPDRAERTPSSEDGPTASKNVIFEHEERGDHPAVDIAAAVTTGTSVKAIAIEDVDVLMNMVTTRPADDTTDALAEKDACREVGNTTASGAVVLADDLVDSDVVGAPVGDLIELAMDKMRHSRVLLRILFVDRWCCLLKKSPHLLKRLLLLLGKLMFLLEMLTLIKRLLLMVVQKGLPYLENMLLCSLMRLLLM